MAVGKKNGNSTSLGDEGSGKHQFQPGDIVLGKIKGYPPWPGILCHEDNVPKRTVLSARPGKHYHIVRFFPAADYGFNTNRDLKLLGKREIEAFLSDPHKRAADLKNAYKLAQDPKEWNDEQNDAVREAEEADENEDELADEGEEDEEVQPVKKRKPSTSVPKPPASKKAKSEPKEKKPSVAPTSSTSNHASSTHNHHKDSADVEGADEAEMDPETKKVKGWRHTLQRGFLPKDGHINASEMEQHDKTFKQVEAYNEITINQLRSTKIGKVMKRIIQLSSVPQDDVYHFQERAQKLCDRWSEVMGISGSASAPATKKEGSAPAPAKDDSSSTPAPVPVSPKKEGNLVAAKTGTNGDTNLPAAKIANGSSEAIVSDGTTNDI
ncbi:hypothetical protein L7F22_042081 [Adiantum nelumboides]|nr:hypothetical protein [Adiantum nelumboides]